MYDDLTVMTFHQNADYFRLYQILKQLKISSVRSAKRYDEIMK